MNDETDEAEIERWHRRLGAEANNQAWKLAEMERRSAQEDARMLHAAHASRHLWSRVGSEQNLALGDLLLGQVHALLGHGESALAYATQAYGYFTSRASEPWELAFAHAVLAHAAHAAGDLARHRRHALEAGSVAATLEAEDRAVFDASFRRISPA